MDLEALKKRAAEAAVARVRSGMRLGLGTGSTARWAVGESTTTRSLSPSPLTMMA